MEEMAKKTKASDDKYLLFELAGEEYGVDILKVREIIGLMAITPVPQTPSFIKGVINLRGKVIPVIDLKVKFGMEDGDYGDRSCIVVIELQGKKGPVLTGVVVDGVKEVVNINPEQIDPPPEMGQGIDARFILGMAKLGERVSILLDMEKVIGDGGGGILQKEEGDEGDKGEG